MKEYGGGWYGYYQIKKLTIVFNTIPFVLLLKDKLKTKIKLIQFSYAIYCTQYDLFYFLKIILKQKLN